jgi:hypothetical protein
MDGRESLHSSRITENSDSNVISRFKVQDFNQFNKYLHQNGLGSDYNNYYVDFDSLKQEKRKLFGEGFEGRNEV